MVQGHQPELMFPCINECATRLAHYNHISDSSGYDRRCIQWDVRNLAQNKVGGLFKRSNRALGNQE